MHNLVYLIGRLEENVKEEGDSVVIKLGVQRSFKNENGIYEKDLFECIGFSNIASYTEYCTKGDLVGIKGRLQTKDNKIVICIEKLRFLTSRKDNEE